MALNLNKPENLTDAEVQEWEAKDKHGRKLQYWEYDTDEGDIARFWVCAPHRNLMFAIADHADKSSKKAQEMLVNGCVIAGDLKELEKDDAMFMGIGGDLGELIQVKKRR